MNFFLLNQVYNNFVANGVIWTRKTETASLPYPLESSYIDSNPQNITLLIQKLKTIGHLTDHGLVGFPLFLGLDGEQDPIKGAIVDVVIIE